MIRQVLFPISTARLLVALIITVLSLPTFGAVEERDGTIVDAYGRMWVADPHYVERWGISAGPVMSRSRAEAFIQAMNAGEIENFGFQDWRLASPFELSRLTESEIIAGELTDLERYLGALDARQSKNTNFYSANYLAQTVRQRPGRASYNSWTLRGGDNDSVYTWPVRFQVGSSGSGVVLLATNSLHIKKDSSVEGDVIVNEVASGPTLVPGVEGQVDQNTTINGVLAADSIGNESSVSAAETLCNDIQGEGPLTCDAGLQLPVVSLPDFETTEGDTSSAPAVTVPRGGIDTIDEGTFGDVELERNATLCLSGGVYDIGSILGGNGSSFVFLAPTEVRVDGQVLFNPNAFIGPEDGEKGCGADSGLSASDMVVFGSASDAATGGISTLPAAAVVIGGKTGQNTAVVEANFYVPNGTLEIIDTTQFTGAVIARDLLVNKDSVVSVDSAFAIPSISNVPTANPQDVFTDGDNNLEIILTGSDPRGEDLSFTITVPPNSAVGSIVSGPTAIQEPATLACSVSRQACLVDGDCPAGETCSVMVFPPIRSAGVTYDPVDASNSPNSFTFKVTNESALEASAVVDINPGGDATPPPTPVQTVDAKDGNVETTTGTPVTITLRGDAPCDEFDASGQCQAGVGLTFAVETGCGDTDPAQTNDCASPTNGSLSNLMQGTATVVRTATVDYTPSGPAGTVDNFEFEACGTIEGSPVCDLATVTVTTVAPTTLAENISVAIQLNQSVDIPLVGNPGGAGGSATNDPSAVSGAGRAVTDFGGFKFQLGSGAGRLVYIGTDPSSDQHVGSADFGTGFCSITTSKSCSNDNGCPSGERCTSPWSGLPNAASQLSANAATWAGKSDDPLIACVEGDPTFFGSHVEDLLNSEGLACSSVIPAADLDTADLSNFEVLYTGATRDNVPDLVAATSNVEDFVNGGGGLVVETNIVDSGSWTWVPEASLIGHSGSTNVGGMDTSIVDPDHPVMQALNGDDLSDWGTSVHSIFVTPGNAGFQVLAEGENGTGGIFEPYIIALDPGATELVFTITELPEFGILVDSTGQPITVGTTLPSSTVTYTNTAPAATDSFTYQVEEEGVFSTAVVDILLSDSCAEVGRPPGCSPDNP